MEQGLQEARTTAFSDQPKIVANRYLIEARIGRGRCGEIYRSLDMRASKASGLERRVALQIVSQSICKDDHLRRAFERELARVKSFGHPNAVRIFELGRDDDMSFVTMELLEGASMRVVLNDALPETVDREEALAVIAAVGDILSSAHAVKLIHGDVRAENAFVTTDYDVKLLDFVSMPGRFSHGENDSSPLTDARHDVYCLACLAYELLTGEHPYGGRMPVDAKRARLEPRPVDDLTHKQWDTLRAGLALAADQRVPTVAEFLRGFGLTGAERLQVVADAPPQREAQRATPASRPAPVTRQRGNEPEVGPALRIDAEAARRRSIAYRQESRTRKWRLVRLLVLLAVAGGLGAATYLRYDEMRLLTAEGFARIAPPADESPTVAASGGETPRGDALRVETVAPELVAGEAVPTRDEPLPVADPARAGTSNVGAAGVGASNDTAAAPLAPPVDLDEGTQTAPSPPSPPGPVVFTLAADGLRVSESSVAARIVVRRTGTLEGQVSVGWRTMDGTAQSGQDYVDLGRNIETFADGEAERAFFIPLIADSRVEDTEHFVVAIDEQPQGAGEGIIESMRVEIVDDDF